MNWISVKERLPEKNVFVLVFAPGSDEVTGQVMYVTWMLDLHERGAIWYDRFLDGCVTHWMPLPARPKEQA